MAAEERDPNRDPLNWQQAQPASRAAWDRVDALRAGTYPDISQAMAASAPGTVTPGGSFATGTPGTPGMAAAVGEAWTSGDTSGGPPGSREDVVDVLQDLVECCKDGEYGFQSCAENARREDLKSIFTQRMRDCQRGTQELQDQIRSLGGDVKDSASMLGALHRGWVSVKSTLVTYDNQATLDEAERGQDRALARYRKALHKPLPDAIRSLVERQLQGVQRNHDQIKMLRNQLRAAN